MKQERQRTIHDRKPLDSNATGSRRSRFDYQPQALFMLRFVGILLVLMLLIDAEWFSRHIRLPLCEFLAESTAFSLRFASMSCDRVGNTISIGRFSLSVVTDCDGLLLFSIYVAAVLALPVANRARAYLAALPGLTILVFLNWVRMPSLALVGAYRQDLFENVHKYFWQWGLICALAGLWIHWARKTIAPLQRTKLPTDASRAQT